ncbi:MAG: hypothetical protein RLZZ558_1529 [Planctomycetota bacterium]|jgi:hypothetical protein
MEETIDYAGLFPPAELSMRSAVEHYARHRTGANRWMLARFVVPVKRLEEFDRAASDLFPRTGSAARDDAWRLTVLVSGLHDGALERELEVIEEFNAAYNRKGGTAAVIDAIETRALDGSTIAEGMERIPEGFEAWVEIPWDRDPRGAIAALSGFDAGAKVRTGGTAAAAHPSPEQLALFMDAAAAAQVPLKATAGLHHPARNLNGAVGCDQFGFLGFFVGACLRWHGRIDRSALQACLEERDARTYRFEEAGVTWGGHRLSVREIDDARQAFVKSFGSCSFMEPEADLRDLGLLPQEVTNA